MLDNCSLLLEIDNYMYVTYMYQYNGQKKQDTKKNNDQQNATQKIEQH
jgi:hypothetical protein